MTDEMAIADVLTRGVAVFNAADIPNDLREAAYTAAVALLTSGQPRSGAGAAVVNGDLIGKIASGLGLDRRQAGNLFADKDGAPELIVKASKLPQTKAARAHDIALLVMASRQLGGLDDYTDPKVLRDAAKCSGKFDQGNFGKHIKPLDNYVITSGKGRQPRESSPSPGSRPPSTCPPVPR